MGVDRDGDRAFKFAIPVLTEHLWAKGGEDNGLRVYKARLAKGLGRWMRRWDE